ncbi:MAG: DDE-type integrase/transposase/recombinase, partial [Candidatus Thiodiazotropha sp. (ex Lucinoma aequizonata)]|nr:DDE-type integrase/transposase/recombinase [Candidatus Thiodiazotropha sp. (ex Lucinoma aequizonata)]MCU7896728.1 DDE-type integrase/transposase/recombinase [Candidatus Thiodiazotropha sp. (ex Lucinoma aequizonata)]
ERELNRKEKALAETAALLVLRKKTQAIWGGHRGKMINVQDRRRTVELIEEAVDAGALAEKACEEPEISLRTYKRRTDGDGVKVDGRPDAERPEPATIADRIGPGRQRYLHCFRIQLLQDTEGGRSVRSPRESASTEESEQTRGFTRLQPRIRYGVGTSRSWRQPSTGIFYRLYLLMDIYSRKIVGWEIHENETADHASLLIRKACLAEGITEQGPVLHSDNGSPMKGATMLATLQRLGVVPSFSRPSVSNDNPYSESLFETMKYTPAFPSKPFESLGAARDWTPVGEVWLNPENQDVEEAEIRDEAA